MDTVNENMLQLASYEVLGQLPNPFIFEDGTEVKSIEDWPSRRKEIAQTAVNLQFGHIPPAPTKLSVELLFIGKSQRNYKIVAGSDTKQVSFLMKLLLPPTVRDGCPLIIDGDNCANYFMQPGFIEAGLQNGIGWALFDRTELAHDVKHEGRSQGALYEVYPDYDFGAIGAWAWGYCRCIDALELLGLPEIDYSWIASSGHSRGAKATILAGAIDERFRVVNPNEACLGGGGCYRVHSTGNYLSLNRWPSETLRDIMEETDFWFGMGMSEYVDHEKDLPFDTHYLKALIAPRILLISEAAGDMWANPVGSWQTTIAAHEVYKFLNAGNNLYWYYRTGTHFHKTSDIEMLVNVIRHCRDGVQLSDAFFRRPFKAYDQIFDWECPCAKHHSGGEK